MTREVPPVIASRGRNVFIWLGLAAAGLGALLLYLFNPAENEFYPRCFFKMATGLDCPGCGGLRATHQLLHGHVREAFALNPLFLFAIPVAAFLGGRVAWEKISGRRWPRLVPHTTALWIAGGVLVAFGVLRNLPWRAWFGT